MTRKAVVALAGATSFAIAGAAGAVAPKRARSAPPRVGDYNGFITSGSKCQTGFGPQECQLTIQVQRERRHLTATVSNMVITETCRGSGGKHQLGTQLGTLAFAISRRGAFAGHGKFDSETVNISGQFSRNGSVVTGTVRDRQLLAGPGGTSQQCDSGRRRYRARFAG